MKNIFSAIFGKKSKPQRVRNCNGMYSRRMKIKENGVLVAYVYKPSQKGFRASGMH